MQRIAFALPPMPVSGAPTLLGSPVVLPSANAPRALRRGAQSTARRGRAAPVRPRAESRESLIASFSIPTPSSDSLWSDVLEIPHLRDQLAPR